MGLTPGQLKADQAVVFTDFPTESVTIGGITYGALVMNLEGGSNWGEGGEVLEKTVRIAINRSDITTIPSEGDTATFRSATYKVGTVDEDDTAASIIVNITLPMA